PRAEALIHRVREVSFVLAEPFVEPGERVVPEVGLVLRQHVALLGVEEEDQPQEDAEKRPVDSVRMLRQGLAQKLAARRVVRSLEAMKKLVQRVQNLLGKPLAHLILEAPAVLEERCEPLLTWQREEALLVDQQTKRGEDRSARGLRHVGDVEVDPARVL